MEGDKVMETVAIILGLAASCVVVNRLCRDKSLKEQLRDAEKRGHVLAAEFIKHRMSQLEK